MGKLLISEKPANLKLGGRNILIEAGQKIELKCSEMLIDGKIYPSCLELNKEVEDLVLENKSETMESIYRRFDHLALHYANKLWNDTDLALEKNDLIQELRLRLFTSIQTYISKWSNYRQGKTQRPIPIEFYLKTVMINKSRDLIKELSAAKGKFSIEESGFQFGSTSVEIRSTSKFDIFCGSQNLMDLFKGKQKTLMKLYFLNDFDLDKVLKHFKNKEGKKSIEKTIQQGIEIIKDFLHNDVDSVEEYQYYVITDEE